MTRRCAPVRATIHWPLAICLGCTTLGTLASAQPALDRLEQQVQSRLLGDAPTAGSATARQVAQREPGYLGILADDRETTGRGVLIIDAVAGGPAAKAGLRAGDLVLSVEGVLLGSMQQLVTLLSPLGPGTEVLFEVERDGRRVTVDVVLGERPAAADRAFQQFGQIVAPGDAGTAPAAATPASLPPLSLPELLGLRLLPVTPFMGPLLQLPSARGALVIDVASGSPAQRANIQTESVLMAIDGQRIDTPDDVARLIVEQGGDGSLKIALYRHGTLFERVVQLDAATQALIGAPRAAATSPGPSDTPGTSAVPGGEPLILRSSDPPSEPMPLPAPATADTPTTGVLEARIESLEARLERLEALLRQLVPDDGSTPALPH